MRRRLLSLDFVLDYPDLPSTSLRTLDPRERGASARAPKRRLPRFSPRSAEKRPTIALCWTFSGAGDPYTRGITPFGSFPGI